MDKTRKNSELTGQTVIHPIRFISVLVIVNAGANAVIVMLAQLFVGPLSMYMNRLEVFIRNVVIPDPERFSLFMAIYVISFILPFVFIIIYTFPVYNLIKKKPMNQKTEVTAKRRVLNLPLYHSFLGASGWIIGYAGNINNFFFQGYNASLQEILFSFIMQLSFAAFTFVLIYYALEFIMRKYYIRIFFPDNKISRYQTSEILSIRVRFFILFFAITIFPILLLSTVGFGQMNPDQLTKAALPVGLLFAGLTGISYLISWLMAESYRKPIREMTMAANKIRRGDFNISIPVNSHDEIGVLSETINEVASELKEKEFMKDTFGKVVDPLVRDQLLSGQLNMDGEIRETTILFSDIRSFTSLSEKLPPEVLVLILNRYFDAITRAITRNGGIVNKFIGDAVLAVFGAPLPMENHADVAITSAMEMIRERENLNRELVNEGHQPIHAGIGIHSGKVISGLIGSMDRMEYTVIGDSVNTSARLESQTKEDHVNILISGSTKQLCRKEYSWRSLGKRTLRGKETPVEVFTLSVPGHDE